jgi:integrator complex subunit 11
VLCRGRQLYSLDDVAACMNRVTGVALGEPLHLPRGITLQAHYAGHVMGAAMFHCRVGASDVLYTGDYNMVPDRLLGAAKVPRLQPDCMITESTYATTLRDSRRARERKLLDAVHSTVRSGGKVLIPVFAVGSAQEMSLLVSSFWNRMHLQVIFTLQISKFNARYGIQGSCGALVLF